MRPKATFAEEMISVGWDGRSKKTISPIDDNVR